MNLLDVLNARPVPLPKEEAISEPNHLPVQCKEGTEDALAYDNMRTGLYQLSLKEPEKLKEGDSNLHPDVVDSMIAKEMMGLSMQQRNQLDEDVHGVSEEVEETPELLQSTLNKMEDELLHAPPSSPYSQAIKMDPAYVRNQDFRLRFLRTDNFNPKAAAERLQRHFKAKLELFGPELLVKDVSQDHLDEETFESLYDGTVQNLPVRDRSGRTICVYFVQSAENSIEAKLRRAFYMSMMSTEDPETQRKGVISVSYLVGDTLSMENFFHRWEWNTRLSELTKALPMRLDAIHLCTDSTSWRLTMMAFKVAAGLFTRLRIRETYANHTECLSQMQTYGIPTEDFPISPEGVKQTEDFVRRMEERRREERRRAEPHGTDPPLEESREVVITPAKWDVLLGRGKAFYEHIGNRRWQATVREFSRRYDAGVAKEKTAIAKSVVAKVKRSHGKFLRKKGDIWIEVTDCVAHKKSAAAFRTLRRGM